MAQVITKIGTFDVISTDGKCILCKDGKTLLHLKNVNPSDKDGIIRSIEKKGKEIDKMLHREVAHSITPANVVEVLEYIKTMLNETLEDKQKKTFISSNINTIISELAA